MRRRRKRRLWLVIGAVAVVSLLILLIASGDLFRGAPHIQYSVEVDLRAIHTAELKHYVTYSKIGSVAELAARGLVEKEVAERPEYFYSCKMDGSAVSCVAHYIGPSRSGLPDYILDESLGFHQVQ